MCIGPSPAKVAQLPEKEEKNTASLASPEDLESDEKKKSKGRRGLRIDLDNSKSGGSKTGLNI